MACGRSTSHSAVQRPNAGIGEGVWEPHTTQNRVTCVDDGSGGHHLKGVDGTVSGRVWSGEGPGLQGLEKNKQAVAVSCVGGGTERGCWPLRGQGKGVRAAVRAHLRKYADGAGHAEEHGVEILLLHVVVLQQHPRVRVHVGPRVLHLHPGPSSSATGTHAARQENFGA